MRRVVKSQAFNFGGQSLPVLQWRPDLRCGGFQPAILHSSTLVLFPAVDVSRPERSMHGQLLLTVADAAAAQDAFETSAGAEALRQGLAAPFPELNADTRMQLGWLAATWTPTRKNIEPPNQPRTMSCC